MLTPLENMVIALPLCGALSLMYKHKHAFVEIQVQKQAWSA